MAKESVCERERMREKEIIDSLKQGQFMQLQTMLQKDLNVWVRNGMVGYKILTYH